MHIKNVTPNGIGCTWIHITEIGTYYGEYVSMHKNVTPNAIGCTWIHILRNMYLWRMVADRERNTRRQRDRDTPELTKSKSLRSVAGDTEKTRATIPRHTAATVTQILKSQYTIEFTAQNRYTAEF